MKCLPDVKIFDESQPAHITKGDTMKPSIIKSAESDSFDFGGLGVNWKLDGSITESRFSVVHHPIAPKALAVSAA